jgi:hypothetical protein
MLQPSFIRGDIGRLDRSIQIDIKAGVARHLVALAAFLVQPQPPALAVLEMISHSHSHRRAHSGETVHHGSNHGPIPQTN